jgi:hypothetical protein
MFKASLDEPHCQRFKTASPSQVHCECFYTWVYWKEKNFRNFAGGGGGGKKFAGPFPIMPDLSTFSRTNIPNLSATGGGWQRTQFRNVL